MTINEAIARVDRVKPNQYEQAEKVRWLSDLDGKLYHEVIGWHEEMKMEQMQEGVRSPIRRDGSWRGYDPEGPLSVPLLVKPPYDDIYTHWLFAQIDYHNSEMDRYQNSMVMFNMAYATYADFVNRTHMPRQEQHIKTSIGAGREPLHRGEGGHWI